MFKNIKNNYTKNIIKYYYFKQIKKNIKKYFTEQ